MSNVKEITDQIRKVFGEETTKEFAIGMGAESIEKLFGNPETYLNIETQKSERIGTGTEGPYNSEIAIAMDEAIRISKTRRKMRYG